MSLERVFQILFAYLHDYGYAWQTVSPDRLVKLREAPGSFDPIVRFFGLGIEVANEELLAAGLPAEILPEAKNLRPAVSRLGDVFLVHAHWPEPRVYLGEESYYLLRQMDPWLGAFENKNVLDLGSGCGVLAFHLAAHGARVLGLELASAAVKWSEAAARAQGLERVIFREARIGAPGAEAAVHWPGEAGLKWDFAVFNPPLAVPAPESNRPHRDGGKLGIEVPLAFLAFAGRHLRAGGEVFCNLTNPVLRDGRSALFDRIEPAAWEIVEKKRLNDQFNRSLHRQDGYQEQGIQRIELFFLRLKKRS